MSYCYLAFRTNVLLNLHCPGHLSYFIANESEPLHMNQKRREEFLMTDIFRLSSEMNEDSSDVANSAESLSMF